MKIDRNNPAPIVLEAVDGPTVEAQVFVDASGNLVVLTKGGFSMTLFGPSILSVAQLVCALFKGD